MRIEFDKVSFAYTKGAPVLENCSLQFSPGITLLKGYSGCGKSTALKLIAGYLQPDRGRVSVPPSDESPGGEFAKRHLGFVFQDVNLLPDATVRRNIELSCALGGSVDTSLRRKRGAECLEKLGLSDLQERKAKTLSGGQKQRAALARAILRDPLVLCLDEPTSGLDDENTRILKSALRDFSADGKIIVIASHDSRLDTMADQLIDFEDLNRDHRAP